MYFNFLWLEILDQYPEKKVYLFQSYERFGLKMFLETTLGHLLLYLWDD